MFLRLKYFIKVNLNYLFFREHRFKREVRRHYLPYYTTEAPTAKNERRMVISMYDGKRYHGGLADRLRGITTIYKFCKDNDLDYRIFFVSPFNLQAFLTPNSYDWRIDSQDISYNRESSMPVYIDTSDIDVKKDLAFQKKMVAKFLTNEYKQTHVYSTAYYEQEHFRTLFNELFKPTPLLSEAVNRQLDAIGGKFISVSTRFLELLGDFNERKGRDAMGLCAEEQEMLINACLEQIGRIRERHPEVGKVLVTSDSEKFASRAKEKYDFVYVIPGRIGHLDVVGGGDENLEIHLKTFVDFFTLSHAEKLYLLVGKGMYHSGFSRRAAQLGDRPFEEIVLY